MKNKLLSLVLLAALIIPVSASEYISTYDFAVVDNRAYLVEIVDSKTYLKQYSFPELVVTNQLELSNDFSYAYASTNGVVVSTYTYDIPTETLVAEGDDSQTKVYKETRTIQTYDLSLAPIATKTSEYEYYYTFFGGDASDGATASGKATPVESTNCSGKKHKGKKKSCNKVLL
jgi:hypothetical protein